MDTTVTDRRDSHTKNIIKRIDEAQEELARIVSAGFEDIQQRLDIREDAETLKRQMKEIRAALHLNA